MTRKPGDPEAAPPAAATFMTHHGRAAYHRPSTSSPEREAITQSQIGKATGLPHHGERSSMQRQEGTSPSSTRRNHESINVHYVPHRKCNVRGNLPYL
ncbi:hypothetical protein ACLB2K_007930 [Fragaria x ananassa]